MDLNTIIIGAVCLILGLVAGTLFAKSSLNSKAKFIVKDAKKSAENIIENANVKAEAIKKEKPIYCYNNNGEFYKSYNSFKDIKKEFKFNKPNIPDFDYSFSGLKTSFLYSLRSWIKDDPNFIENNKNDLAASLEATVVDILMDKLRKAAKKHNIKEIAVAGGVSANNGLRNSFREHAQKYGWNIYIPKFSYTTDNAAMIAINGYFKYLDNDF